MNKQLEKLYIPLTEEDREHNPFRTPEIYEKYKDFFDTYFSISVMTLQEYDTAYAKFWNFANAIEENAFEVGFYTAVQLLTVSKEI